MIRHAMLAAPLMAAAVSLASCDNAVGPLPSLKDEPGYFRPAANAPQSTFGPAGAASAMGGAELNSSFGPAAGPDSEFRLAEVAPGQLDAVRGLLSELGAKQGADNAIRFFLPADILFDFDKATLRPDAAEPLRKAQELIAAYPDAPVAIVGHTDAKGDDAYNDRLSLARARSVSDRLAAGIDRAARVTGAGERQPVAPNARPDGSDDPDGRQRNRRVEIILLPVPAQKGA